MNCKKTPESILLKKCKWFSCKWIQDIYLILYVVVYYWFYVKIQYTRMVWIRRLYRRHTFASMLDITLAKVKNPTNVWLSSMIISSVVASLKPFSKCPYTMVNQCSIVAFRSSGTMFRGKTLWIHTCLLRSSMIRLLRHSRSKGSILSWCTTWKEWFETLQKKRIKLSQVTQRLGAIWQTFPKMHCLP